METILTVIIPAAVSVVVALIVSASNRGKVKAEETATLTGAAMEQVNSLRVEVKDLREQLEELRDKLFSVTQERDKYRDLYEAERNRNDDLEARIIRLEKTVKERESLVTENVHLREQLRNALNNGGGLS